MNRMKRLIFVAVVVGLLVAPGSVLAAQKIMFGVMAKDRAEADKTFAGLFAHLNASQDVTFEISTYPSYEDVYSALKAKKVDVALIGAVLYAQAHYEIGAQPIIAEGGMIRSMIVVRKGSPIKDVKELKGKSFAFGYDNSTSTHLIPLLLLSKSLIKQADLGKTAFIGSDQNKIVAKVVSGEYDAAGLVEPVFNENKDKLRAIETSDPFPGSPLVARKDADPRMLDSLRRLFLSYKPVAGQRFAKGAIAVTDGDFNQVRFLCKVVLGKSYI